MEFGPAMTWIYEYADSGSHTFDDLKLSGEGHVAFHQYPTPASQKSTASYGNIDVNVGTLHGDKTGNNFHCHQYN